uniref:C-type lectin domain-containing protein n=1 Tax=Ditylenchus dipsaci TaxID=166011 RepID=A0A915E5Y2_9BILA
MTKTTESTEVDLTIDYKEHRFPMSICWAPIPLLSWFIPFIGHVGIATTDGKIRDFAGDYRVNKDKMGIGWPTSYCQLSMDKVAGGASVYDQAIEEASDEYKRHRHRIFSDNCHSHVALALNNMQYDGKEDWNAMKVFYYMLRHGRPTSCIGFTKQYVPFVVLFVFFTVAFRMEYTDFSAAERNCYKHSSHLASFHSLKEFQFISKVLADQFGKSFDGSVWTGLYHKHEDLDGLPNFQLYFTDGSQYDLPTNEKIHGALWNKIDGDDKNYEPNGFDHGGGPENVEYCAELVKVGNEYRLNDMVCHNAAPVHVCRFTDSTVEFVGELPSEVINGEISPNTRSGSPKTMTTNDPPPPPPTPSTTSVSTATPKAATPSSSTPSVVPVTPYKSGDTFYFVLFLLAFLFLVLETGYIYWLHRKNPGLNSFTFKNF